MNKILHIIVNSFNTILYYNPHKKFFFLSVKAQTEDRVHFSLN